MEAERLTAHRNALIETRNYLTEVPNPRTDADAEVFIGRSSLNKIFSKVDGLSFPLPENNEIVLTVNSIRMNFGGGYPEVQLDIRARHTKYGFAVKVKAHANLEIGLVNPEDPKGYLRIHVAELVPEAEWFFLRIRFWLFIRQLLQVEAQKFVDRKMPTSTFPASIVLGYEVPSKTAVTFDFLKDGRVIGGMDGYIETPGFDERYRLAVHTLLTLEDGVHAYGKLEKMSEEQIE
ncbi:MAG: hypothetical protein QNJ73_10165 [Gammaproteobacteria bacterium]|nr:hypothetical protein [Gammaproteobacteria bacterium]